MNIRLFLMTITCLLVGFSPHILSGENQILVPGEITTIRFWKNNAYVATADKGIYLFTPTNLQLTPLPINTHISGNIQNIAFHPDGLLYVATNKGLYLTSENKIEKHYHVGSGFFSNTILCVDITPEGVVWIGTNKGLVKLDQNDYQVITEINGLPCFPIQSIKIDLYSQIWVKHGEYLSVLVADKWITLKNAENEKPLKNIRTFSFDHAGSAYVASGQKIIVYKNFKPSLQINIAPVNLNHDPFGRVYGINENLIIQMDQTRPPYFKTVKTDLFDPLLNLNQIYIDPIGNKYLVAKTKLVFLPVNKSDPFYYQALLNFANSYRAIGENEKALGLYQTLMDYFTLQEQNNAVLLKYAELTEKLGNEELSLQSYMQIINSQQKLIAIPEEQKHIYTMALLKVAGYYKKKMDSYCVGFYRRILQENHSLPAVDSAYIQLSDYYIETGLKTEAIALLENYLQLFSHSSSYSSSYWFAKSKLLRLYQETRHSHYQKSLYEFFTHCPDVTLLYQFDEEWEAFQNKRLIGFYQPTKGLWKPIKIEFPGELTCAEKVENTWWIGTKHHGLYKIIFRYGKRIEYDVKPITEESGFVGRYVNHILQDSRKQLWISSLGVDEQSGGLYRYDGKQFIRYTVKDGLLSDSVLATFEQNNTIYCLTAKGICAANADEKIVWRKILHTRNANQFVVDKNNRIIYSDGRHCFIYQNNQIRKVEFENKTDHSIIIYRIELDPNEGLLIYTSSGFYKEDQAKAQIVVSHSLGHKKMTRAVFLEKEDLWFGHDRGLTRYHPQYELHYDTTDALPNNKVIDIKPWQKYKVVVTAGGIVLLEHSPSDTVKMIQYMINKEKQFLENRAYSQARQMYRLAPKGTWLREYCDYRIGMLFEEEGKYIEAFNWYIDRTVENPIFINEYVYYRLAMKFFKNKMPEQSFNVMLHTLQTFSSVLKREKQNKQSDSLKTIVGKNLISPMNEKNQLILSFENGMRKIAYAYYKEKDYTQSLLWHSRASHIFIPQKRSVKMLLECAAELEKKGDAVNALRLYRLLSKENSLSETADRSLILWRLAKLCQQTEQYSEAGKFYKMLSEMEELIPIRQQLISLTAQMKNYSKIGLLKGGYEEANTVNAMVFEGNYLWLGTSRGVIRWDLTTNTYKKWTENNGLIVNNITSIALDGEGGKWFGGYRFLPDGKIVGGVSYYDGEQFTNYSTKELHPNTEEVHCVRVDRNGKLWIGTNQGISRLDQDRWMYYPLKKKFPFSFIADMAFDYQNRLWIACQTQSGFYSSSGGLIKFDDSIPTVLRERNGLSSNNVKSIRIDDNNHLWINTDKGITIYNPLENKMLYLKEKDGLPSLVIRDIEFGDSNRIWAATNKGISKIDWDQYLVRSETRIDQTKTVFTYTEKHGLLTNDIRRVVYHPEHGTWVGTRRGCFSIDQLSTTAKDEEFLLAYNKKLFEISSESESLFERARHFLESGEYDRAREIYLDVLDRAGQHNWADDAVLLLARSYEMQGNYEESQKYYEMLIQKYPDSDLLPEAYIGLGMIAEKNNQYEKAIQFYKEAETRTHNKGVISQTQLLTKKAEIKRMVYERSQVEKIAALISEKSSELNNANVHDTERIKRELKELEEKAIQSAKAAGYNLKLYKVKKDDTLWDLSKKFLGDPYKWKDFFIANEGRITDPNMIYVGQTIVVLTLEKSYNEKLESFLKYTVLKGEDLATIANKLYGDEKKWIVIYQANKESLPYSPKKTLKEMQILIPIE